MILLCVFQKSISLKKMLSSGTILLSVPLEDDQEIILFTNPYSGSEQPDQFLG